MASREYVSYFTRFPDAPERAAKDIWKPDNIDAPPTTGDESPEAETADGDDIPF